MSFTYIPGSALTSPNLAGGIEIPGFTIGSDPFRINDGTYELHRLGGVLDGTPDIRDAVYVLPSDDGGVAGLPFLNPRQIALEGMLTVPTLPDVWGAIDLLKQAFNIGLVWLQGLQLMTINTTGWSHKRQMYVQARPLSIVEPDGLAKLTPDRLFTVNLVAPDPLMYNADVLQAVTVSSTTLTNNGTAPSPFVVRFNGAATNPTLTGPGLTGKQIAYNGSVASGHWVEVGTNPRGDGTGLYAVNDSGTDVSPNLTAFTARTIPAGSSSWAYSGGGTCVVSFRDAWY